MLTMEAYAANFPPGVMNFVSGSGRATVSPIMRTGKIDILSFIGSSKAADAIIKVKFSVSLLFTVLHIVT